MPVPKAHTNPLRFQLLLTQTHRVNRQVSLEGCQKREQRR
jgi:hypothetical protein